MKAAVYTDVGVGIVKINIHPKHTQLIMMYEYDCTWIINDSNERMLVGHSLFGRHRPEVLMMRSGGRRVVLVVLRGVSLMVRPTLL